MGARRFGPSTARFLQADKYDDALDDLDLGFDPLTQNRYSLAGGNPINFVEVDGHRVIPGGGGSSSPTPGSGCSVVMIRCTGTSTHPLCYIPRAPC